MLVFSSVVVIAVLAFVFYGGNIPAEQICRYESNLAEAVTKNLNKYIREQDEAVGIISRALYRRSLEMTNDARQALVFNFWGPTGVGKSESAYRLAEGALQTAYKNRIQQPHGLLHLSCASDAEHAEETQKRIRVELANHLRECGGNGVVIIDEVQRIQPGVLKVLMEAVDERGEFRGPDGTFVSTRNAIFIFISDIGHAKMTDLVFKHGGRAAIPLPELKQAGHEALDEQWVSFTAGKFIGEVVPFFAMEPQQMRAVLKSKLRLTAENGRAQKRWHDVAFNNRLIGALTSDEHVAYQVVRQTGSEGELLNCQIRCQSARNGYRSSTSHEVEFGSHRCYCTALGPLADLEGKMLSLGNKPDKVLHIGYFWENPQDQIIFQWCDPARLRRVCTATGDKDLRACGLDEAPYEVDNAAAMDPNICGDTVSIDVLTMH